MKVCFIGLLQSAPAQTSEPLPGRSSWKDYDLPALFVWLDRQEDSVSRCEKQSVCDIHLPNFNWRKKWGRNAHTDASLSLFVLSAFPVCLSGSF